MGASQSKGDNQPMVFVNEENPIPVRVSSAFVNQLQQSQPTAGSSQDIEAQVRQRVQAELARIQAEKSTSADTTHVGYKSSTNANAVVTEQEMETLGKKQGAHTKQIKVLPEEITKAQEALVQCYKKNQERSLDCWAEVQEFKDLVQKAQNAFIATA
ncbi:hypothetical protein BC939DRAFT_453897 [Gamsiella multidivaricata]|uniref:uncharacterized protein n=1 Tax=Gamsiella multidivaricata TaxID=101098 RepID=UPI002220A3C4|nr:uncharacterized protein BC939DRAFT_453897 [Gamsiella multidivaricata]KAG0360361.1 hypothetical protein BGZ54_009584 [Gamsiella multidivaricata]KAI7822354.1 hypothetical protein BC939DRAFT_453897 [Gamsiella multidivaricata]